MSPPRRPSRKRRTRWPPQGAAAGPHAEASLLCVRAFPCWHVATLARRSGQPALAAEAFGRLAALEPNDATPLIQKARALLAMKDHAGAVMAGREAIARDEGNPEAWQVTGLNLGVALERTGRAEEAKTAYGRAMDLSPKYVKARVNAARIAMARVSAPLGEEPGTMSDAHPMPGP